MVGSWGVLRGTLGSRGARAPYGVSTTGSTHPECCPVVAAPAAASLGVIPRTLQLRVHRSGQCILAGAGEPGEDVGDG